VQEQVNERAVALYIKAGKLTGQVLARAMRAFLKKARAPAVHRGEQSVKSLTRQGASLSSIEITSENIGSFKKTARKYNVDFALKRDNSETTPKWLVFFKARDADALTAAFNEYSHQMLQEEKSQEPPLLAVLQKAKELIGQIAAPIKSRQHGEREL
jgi:hypothetical protein